MSYPVFYPPASTTLYIPFATYAGATGASITLTGLAVTDIEIYKAGSVTQRSSDAGYTLLDTDGIDFDGITGIHGFSIDLNDNTDAGFYAAGSSYFVVVSSVTVDGQTVNFIAAWFRIMAAETTSGTPNVTAAALTTAAKAEVNAEVLDVLNVDTFAEIGQETPAATQTIRKMIAYLYKFLRNRTTVSGTTISVYNDDATTVGQKSTHADSAGTYDRGEFTTGP
jgi:hypothetical protein